jgi:16S rRNA processing protein RimM
LGAPDRLVALGVFGAPQGVRGEIRIKSYTADPSAVGAYGPLTDAAGARRFAVGVVRPLRDDMVVARVEGIATREAAAALTGVELYARRSQLPPPEADEFYYDDLIGLEAATADGAPLGRVTAVLNHGAGDILEIAPAGGGETLLLPFTKAVAPEIDFAAGRIVIAPPPEIDGETPD